MGDAIAIYILSATMLGSFISLAAYILGGFHGYHSAASVLALAASLYIASVSPGQATAVTVTLLLWAQFIYRIRVYLALRRLRLQRRIRLLRRPPPPPQKMSTPYYQLQQPLLCHHRTCWAAASAFSTSEKKGPDGLTPFMREQWALAAPGIPPPDMEEILSTLTVTPAHHFERLVCWVKESWESLPRNAILVVSAVVCVLAVRPAKTVVKFLSHVDWTRVYVVVGMLVFVWLCRSGMVERAPAPKYETVVSYYLVPEVRGWCKFSFLWISSWSGINGMKHVNSRLACYVRPEMKLCSVLAVMNEVESPGRTSFFRFANVSVHIFDGITWMP